MGRTLSRFSKLAGCFFTFLLPSLAFGNAGTPLIWLGMIHLVFGNLVIGVLEGLLLSWILKTKKIRSILVMVLGNYITAFLGYGVLVLFLSDYPEFLQPSYFFYTKIFVGGIFIFLYLLTIFVESGFCYWAQVGGDRMDIKRAIRASAIIQTTSYLTILPLYYLSSVIHFGPGLHLDRPERVDGLSGYFLYLNSEENEVRRIDFSDLHQSRVIEKIDISTDSSASLVLDVDREQKPSLQYFYSERNGQYFNIKSKRLSTEIEGQGAAETWKESLFREVHAHQVASKGDDQRRLRLLRDDDFHDYGGTFQKWQIAHIGTWGIEGFKLKSSQNPEESIWIAVESPPFVWRPSHVSRLPGERYLLSWGPHIVILDANRKTLSWISTGKSPVPVLLKD